MDMSTKARGKETKRRKTRGTFSLKQVKQIRSTPLATDYRNSSVLVIRAHSRTKEFPGTCPALAGWLSKNGLLHNLYTLPRSHSY